MIVDAFLNGILVVFDALWAVVPAWTIQLDTTNLLQFRAYVTGFNTVLPVTEAFLLLGITSAVFAFLYAVKGVYKVIGWVRGSG